MKKSKKVYNFYPKSSILMKSVLFWVALILTSNCNALRHNMKKNIFYGEWSNLQEGLKARFIIIPESINDGNRLKVVLEVYNLSASTASLSKDSKVELVLYDTHGKDIPPEIFPMSGIFLPTEFGQILPNTYVGYRVDNQTIAVPNSNKVTMLSVGEKSWVIKKGAYKAKFNLMSEKTDIPKTWTGSMTFQLLEITR